MEAFPTTPPNSVQFVYLNKQILIVQFSKVTANKTVQKKIEYNILYLLAKLCLNIKK